MDVAAKGWRALAIGLFFVAFADTFATVVKAFMLEHIGSYGDGNPYNLLWYYGLFLLAYGAYFQRKLHMKMIEF